MKINHKTVLRLIQKMGLRAVARKRKVYMRLEEIVPYHHYPNLLQRDFFRQSFESKMGYRTRILFYF